MTAHDEIDWPALLAAQSPNALAAGLARLPASIQVRVAHSLQGTAQAASPSPLADPDLLMLCFEGVVRSSPEAAVQTLAAARRVCRMWARAAMPVLATTCVVRDVEPMLSFAQFMELKIDGAPESSSDSLYHAASTPSSLPHPKLLVDQQLAPPLRLRPEEKLNAHFMLKLYVCCSSGILRRSGMRPPAQAIALMALLKEQHLRGYCLALVPADEIETWATTCAQLVPSIAVTVYAGGPEEREALRKTIFTSAAPPLSLVICSHEVAMEDHADMNPSVDTDTTRFWKMLLIDEGTSERSQDVASGCLVLFHKSDNTVLFVDDDFHTRLADPRYVATLIVVLATNPRSIQWHNFMGFDRIRQMLQHCFEPAERLRFETHELAPLLCRALGKRARGVRLDRCTATASGLAGSDCSEADWRALSRRIGPARMAADARTAEEDAEEDAAATMRLHQMYASAPWLYAQADEESGEEGSDSDSEESGEEIGEEAAPFAWNELPY